MSAKDFSRGAPRSGQWVVLDGKHLGIACGPDLGHHTLRFGRDREFHVVAHPAPGTVLKAIEPAAVEVVYEDGRAVLTDALLVALTGRIKDTARPILAGFFLVDLVDPVEGLTTTEHLLVHLNRLVPLLDKSRIPPKRLSTMLGSFQLTA